MINFTIQTRNMKGCVTLCLVITILVQQACSVNSESNLVDSQINNSLDCSINFCLPKCCSNNEVFSFASLECVPVLIDDFSWIPKISSNNANESVEHFLSENKKEMSLNFNRNGKTEVKKINLVYHRPECEHYGPTHSTLNVGIDLDRTLTIKDTSEQVGVHEYCIDVSSDTDLPANISLSHIESHLLILTCFRAMDDTMLHVAKGYLLMIGLIISCISLSILVFFMIILIQKGQLRGHILLCHAASLLVGDIVLALNYSTNTWSDEVCLFLAITMHYSFLATFFWLNVMCYDIMRSVSPKINSSSQEKTSEKRRFLFFSLYAWGLPSIIVIISVIIHLLPDHHFNDDSLRPSYATGECWIQSDTLKIMIYFYGIIGILFVVNLMLVMRTIWLLRKTGISFSCSLVCCRPCSKNKVNSQLDMFWHRFLIFVMMVACWMTEIISWLIPSTGGWLMTDFLNTLQGLLLLLLFLLHPENRQHICQIWKKGPSTEDQEVSNNHTDIYSIQT